MEELQEFYSSPWALRALWCEDVQEGDSGETIDVWIWFVARGGEDLWMAHGLSAECNGDVADRMRAGIDGRDMDVLITYAGEPWSIIAPMPVQHAQMMRDMAVALEDVPSEMERLRGMSRSELENERKRLEIEVMTRQEISEN